MSYESQVKTFRGVVRIQDVQAEFARLVNGINSIVDTLNNLDGLQYINFDIGSTSIPSPGQTLTLGALKTILNIYNGCIVGGNSVCVKDPNSDTLIFFPSLYVDKNVGITQIGNTTIEKQSNAIDVYVNPSDNELSFTDGEGKKHIACLDWVRDEVILNTTEDNIFINPDKSPEVVMTANNFKIKDTINLKSDNAMFFLPCMRMLPDGNGWTSDNLIDSRGSVWSNDPGNSGGKHKGGSMYIYTPIWVPKGLSNKITMKTGSGTVKPSWKALYYTLKEKT